LTSLPFWLPLDQLSFEEVVPVRLEMIERFLKVVDVSRLWELQRFDRFEENPLCVRRDGWNVCSRRVCREGKSIAVAFIPKKIDAHRFPLRPRKMYTTKWDFFIFR
jgi:hypothetical protein